jgi:hypothetical protein
MKNKKSLHKKPFQFLEALIETPSFSTEEEKTAL